MTIWTGKEMDTVVTVITAVTIQVDLLGQIRAVIVVIILDFSSVNHLPAAIGTVLLYCDQAVANRTHHHSAHPERKVCNYYMQMNQL